MSNNPKSTKIVATAKFKDFAAYRSWWMSEDKDFEWMSNFMDTRGKEPGAGSYMPYMDRFSALPLPTAAALLRKKRREKTSV